MTRVAVYIDYQNVYKSTREVFGLIGSGFTAGQVYPRRLGVLLTDRGRPVDPARTLESVWVYRGEPSAKHSPKGMAACQRQVRYWDSQGSVTAWTRPLHYYHRGVDGAGQEIWEAREKGVDVKLAIDAVTGAVNNDYDVCVLCSGDTDMIPAIEAIRALGKRCEVMAWRSRQARSSRITIDGVNLWCHWLNELDYQRVHDPADYTKALPTPPSANP